VEAVDIVLAQLALDRRLDAQEHAQRCMRAGIAANLAFRDRQAGDIFGLPRHFDHVGDAHTDILGGDVAAAVGVHRLAESRQQLCALGPFLVCQNDALAAAQRQAGHGVFVAHAARQAEGVGQREIVLGIVPEARAAGSRAEMRRVDRDDRLEADCVIREECQLLVRVEI
jgi:hypothetical protein